MDSAARQQVLDRYRRWNSLPAMVLAVCEEQGDAPFLWHKAGGEWHSLSFAGTRRRILALAHALVARGLQPGDRCVLLSENRPEWLIVDCAILAAGGVTVPAYTSYREDDHHYLLQDSEPRFAFVSTPALARHFLPAAAGHTGLEAIFQMDLEERTEETGNLPERVLSLKVLEAQGENRTELPPPMGSIARDDLACLIYTSGTSGNPKGVMLSHGAMISNCMGAFDLLADIGLEKESFLSFLPLSHAYEHTAGQFFPASIGAQIWYAEGIDALQRNLQEVKPTIMTAVPRLYETLHARIMHQLRKASKMEQRLFHKTVALGSKAYRDPSSLNLFEKLLNRILDRLVRRKVADRFGGRLKAMVSGGGPLNIEIGTFFLALGLPILQGYGQTETAPVAACNRPRRIKIHTVGPALIDVDLRIAEDGEILIRGELTMKGYWKNPEATESTLKDGWVATGDVGRLDEDGYLEITDRKKDIIVTSGGDNVAPQRVEGFLQIEPEIGHVMVYGDRRPYLVAAVVPDATFAAEWAREHATGRDLAALAEDNAFKSAVEKAFDRVNRKLQPHERVRRFTIVPDTFSIENGMLTPSLKIKRHVVRDRYKDSLEALY